MMIIEIEPIIINIKLLWRKFRNIKENIMHRIEKSSNKA
jgi:hypothetical protein